MRSSFSSEECALPSCETSAIPVSFIELGTTLRRKGVPRTYVNRLVAELHDHYVHLKLEKMREGMGESIAEHHALKGVGDLGDVADQVLRTPGPWSFARRHPFLTFAVVPVAGITLGTAASLFLAIAVFYSATRVLAVSPVQPHLRAIILGGFEFATLALPPVLCLFFWATASRRNCDAMYAVMATALLACIAGFSRLDLVLCPASGSVTYFHFTELNVAGMLGPIVVAILYAGIRYGMQDRRNTLPS